MDLTETVTLITWVNQHDPRVQVNKGARDIWGHSLAPYAYDECRQAVLDHYRINDEDPVTPAKVRKRAEMVRSARAGSQSAIEAKPAYPKHPSSWRSLNPERWDELLAQGAAERRRQLGIAQDAT